jgi:hypothetical protein
MAQLHEEGEHVQMYEPTRNPTYDAKRRQGRRRPFLLSQAKETRKETPRGGALNFAFSGALFRSGPSWPASRSTSTLWTALPVDCASVEVCWKK